MVYNSLASSVLATCVENCLNVNQSLTSSMANIRWSATLIGFLSSGTVFASGCMDEIYKTRFKQNDQVSLVENQTMNEGPSLSKYSFKKGFTSPNLRKVAIAISFGAYIMVITSAINELSADSSIHQNCANLCQGLTEQFFNSTAS